MKHLILGNSAAGITAAQKIREINGSDEITVVTHEDVTAYAKIMLPDYIGGMRLREKLFLRDDNFYENSKINLLKKCGVTGINTGKKSVNLDCGKELKYDRLLIAMGASPFIPKIKGLNNDGYFTLNSIEDADKIKENAIKGRNAIIVGAGLTGIEICFALKNNGMNVSLIDRGDRLLNRQLDEKSSQILEDSIVKHGVKIFHSATVEEVRDEKNMTAVLDNGDIIDFDMFVISSGTKPNTFQAIEAGINCDRGIIINEFMQTSVPDIYAAGDIAEFGEKDVKGYATGYIWPNAMAQGKCAAQNMAGVKKTFSYSEATINPLQLRDVPFMSVGLVNPDFEDYEILSKHENGIYKRIVIKDDIIKGMVVFGDMPSALKLLKLYRESTVIKTLKNDLL